MVINKKCMKINRNCKRGKDMTERMRKLLGIPGILLALVIFFAGCATVSKEVDREGALRKTAERYWNLRMEDKYEDTYKIEDKQKLIPFEEYQVKAKAMKKINIKSISVQSVNVSDDKGAVDLEWTYLLPQITQPFHQVIADSWVYKNGKWWHELR